MINQRLAQYDKKYYEIDKKLFQCRDFIKSTFKDSGLTSYKLISESENIFYYSFGGFDYYVDFICNPRNGIICYGSSKKDYLGKRTLLEKFQYSLDRLGNLAGSIDANDKDEVQNFHYENILKLIEEDLKIIDKPQKAVTA